MLKNYLKIAFRNLWKRRMISGINIFGLAVAVGASLLLFITALHEFSFDEFHAKGDNIYRLYREIYHKRETDRETNMPTPLQPALKEEITGLEDVVRWAGSGAAVIYQDKQFRESIRFTDKGFFKMFSFKLLQGSRQTALEDPNSVVLSEEVAKRIFGEENPMGKTLEVNAEGVAKNLIVNGVIEKTPNNSSLRYGIITRFENRPGYAWDKEKWDDFSHDVFVSLSSKVKPSSLRDPLKEVVQKYLSNDRELMLANGAIPDAEGEVVRLKLQPLGDIRFDTHIGRGGVNKAIPFGLIIVGFFILTIACINFVNLSLGGSLARAKEVGVRKVLGANRSQLIFQFWGEAILVIGMATILGMALAQWLLPDFNALIRKSLTLYDPNLAIAIGLILIFSALAGGIYPAFVISRFQAAEILKSVTKVQKKSNLQNVLIFAQFSLSILLISCTIIVTQQLNYLRNKPLGFNEEQVVSIPIGNAGDSNKLLSRMRSELSKYPQIKSVTAGYGNLGLGKDGSSVTSVMGFDQEGKQLSTHWQPVDYGFFETLEIPILKGRTFSKEHPTDSATAIIINETFARQLEEEGNSAVGTILQLNPDREVIGIAKDFHFKSLEKNIAPLSLILGGDQDFRYSYIFVRITNERLGETMNLLEKTWKNVNPQGTFIGSFLNENTNRLYKAEQVMGKLFTSAAVLAIILSCMGLFGIALMVIIQRTKEIGIRKVLGASAGSIITLISKDFIKIVAFSIFVAAPLAWWGMNFWLSNYAYSIKIQWWVFLLAGSLAIVIAFFTLSLQTVRAARANPVDALRSE